MSIHSQTQVRKMVDFYIEAEIQVLAGKSISREGRTWTRENLPEIRRGRHEWERRLVQLNRPSGPALASFE